jgi:hypothetical protein
MSIYPSLRIEMSIGVSPNLETEAELVPCADLGTRTIFLLVSFLSKKESLMTLSPRYSP